jgi:hypothetical protein
MFRAIKTLRLWCFGHAEYFFIGLGTIIVSAPQVKSTVTVSGYAGSFV